MKFLSYMSTLNWHKNVVQKLLSIFNISKKEKASFRYIGLNVMQMGKYVFVDQNSYISSLKPLQLSAESFTK